MRGLWGQQAPAKPGLDLRPPGYLYAATTKLAVRGTRPFARDRFYPTCGGRRERKGDV
jgi:hypothetical protein